MNDTKPSRGDGLPENPGWRRSWDAVAATLTEVAPGWDTPDGTCDKDRACNAIRRLATPEQPGSNVQGEREAFIRGYKHGACHYIGGDSGEELQAAAEWSVDHQDPEAGVFTTPPPAPAAEHVPNMSSFQIFRKPPVTQPEYFPDGSDSPIRDEARGVEQDESIARRIDRVVFDPMRVADKTRKERQPEARDAEHGKREADRRRFPDPDFNAWLDQGISDCGHTVWDAVGDVQAAWEGWQAARHAEQGECDLGVGCDEAGVCYALANGHPEQCGRGFQPEARGVEGMVLVPREPTEAMIEAGRYNKGTVDCLFVDDDGQTVHDFVLAYRAMLAAAPAAPGVRVDEAMANRFMGFFNCEAESTTGTRLYVTERANVLNALTAAIAPDGGEEE